MQFLYFSHILGDVMICPLTNDRERSDFAPLNCCIPAFSVLFLFVVPFLKSGMYFVNLQSIHSSNQQAVRCGQVNFYCDLQLHLFIRVRRRQFAGNGSLVHLFIFIQSSFPKVGNPKLSLPIP